jgi:hypothetical protein
MREGLEKITIYLQNEPVRRDSFGGHCTTSSKNEHLTDRERQREKFEVLERDDGLRMTFSLTVLRH